MRRVKNAFKPQLFLQLFKRRIKVALSVLLHRIYIELILTVAFINRYAPGGYDLHAVLRLKIKTRSRASEHNRAQYARFVFKRHIQMPRCVPLEVGYFTLYIYISENRNLIKYILYIKIKLTNRQRQFLKHIVTAAICRAPL